MTGRTHLLGALAAAAWVVPWTGHPLTVALSAMAGGLLPDWDHPHSTLGRWIPWPSVEAAQGPGRPPRVGRAGWPHPIWHRHQAHSVALAGALTGAAAAGAAIARAHGWGPLPGPLALGLAVGQLSHLFLDGFNETRQWWGWPFTRRGFRWPVHAPVRGVDPLAFLGCAALAAWGWWAHLAALVGRG